MIYQKILSVNKALSIQAHPSKDWAKKLFKEDPEHYKDDNYKPEMIIALGKFEALNRFCTAKNIIKNIEQFPEVIDILGKQCYHEFIIEKKQKQQQLILKKMIQNLINQEQKSIDKVIEKIQKKIDTKLENNKILSIRENLIQRLNQWYPNDAGILVSLFLNYTVLEKGESLILDENQPHAYVQGECLECMASGDNVVRLGLTPKFKDRQTIMDMLTFSLEDTKIQKGKLISGLRNLESTVLQYYSEYEEFKVNYLILEDINQKSQIFKSEGPLVVLPYQNEWNFE
ncbi:RmlC-like cupin domain [Pseudocohnilembus persalinus]|uniref:mannose-6-phosphate isomerase n=1 Tax=Pseudocohnilembus persalinus TaxID=266149 RepID=A0A0V0QG18_PSEPJ|nr:RmlC-like cupin domain [Pseudocohnilembus persalinus]|eukprot:KRX01169.1 RmlC-like cupin domain [Pseudocohnilembus persalinus]